MASRAPTATALTRQETRLPAWVFDAIEDLETEIFYVRGGYGAAKTYNAAAWFLDRCFKNAAPRDATTATVSWAVAQTHGKIEDTLLKPFQQQLFAIRGYRPEVHYRIRAGNTGLKILFNTIKHEIHFKSADKPKFLVGTNVTHWLVSEAGLQPKEVVDRCVSRARDGSLVQGMCEGTPEDDPIALWYEQEANFIGRSPDGKSRVFEIWTEHNRFLKPSPERYIAALRQRHKHDPAKLESYLYGRFVRFHRGTAYHTFREARHKVRDVRPSKYLPIYLCWDFNFNPLAWVAMQRQPHEHDEWEERTHRFVALRESTGEAKNIRDACIEFAHQFPTKYYADTSIEVYGDASGRAKSHKIRGSDYDAIEQHLAEQGYRNVEIAVGRYNPRVRTRVDKVVQLLAYDLFVVSDKCPRLIESLLKTSFKPWEWKLEKPSGEEWTHYSDAVGYGLFQLTEGMDLENPDEEEAIGVSV